MRAVVTRIVSIVFPLTSVLLIGGCTPHQRLHHHLVDLHEHPYTQAEHERFPDDLRALHEDAHENGYYGHRYYGRGPTYGYDGGRYWDGYY